MPSSRTTTADHRLRRLSTPPTLAEHVQQLYRRLPGHAEFAVTVPQALAVCHAFEAYGAHFTPERLRQLLLVLRESIPGMKVVLGWTWRKEVTVSIRSDAAREDWPAILSCIGAVQADYVLDDLDYRIGWYRDGRVCAQPDPTDNARGEEID